MVVVTVMVSASSLFPRLSPPAPEYGSWWGLLDDSVHKRKWTHRGAQRPRNGSCLCKSKHVGCYFQYFENEIIFLSFPIDLQFCSGTPLTPLSHQRDLWQWQFLARLLAIGLQGEGLKTHSDEQDCFDTILSEYCSQNISRYGNSSISWQRILGPSISMAKEGIPVSNTLAGAIEDKNWFAKKN